MSGSMSWCQQATSLDSGDSGGGPDHGVDCVAHVDFRKPQVVFSNQTLSIEQLLKKATNVDLRFVLIC